MSDNAGKIKLLLVTYGLNTIGGLQSWQHLLVHELLRRGHMITILEMYDYSESMPDKRFVREWNEGIKIIKINGPIVQRGVNPNTNRSALKVVLNVFQKMKLDRFISKGTFDAMLLPDPNFAFFFFKSTLRRTNCIVQFHSSFDRFKATSKLRYVLTKRRMSAFKKFLFLSQGDVSKAINNGFDEAKLSYIFNFIDERKYVEVAKMNIAKTRQLLVVGNLDNPDKQIDHVLRAFSMIDTAVRSNWKIKIVGDGTTKMSLVQLSQELEIEQCIEFAGKKANPVNDYFESRFYVLSSSFEGFPLTLLECIHSNLPIIAYECAPSIVEIVHDNVNGIVVRPGDIGQLSQSMDRLMRTPELLESMSLKQNEFKEKFGIESTLLAWEKLFSC